MQITNARSTALPEKERRNWAIYTRPPGARHYPPSLLPQHQHTIRSAHCCHRRTYPMLTLLLRSRFQLWPPKQQLQVTPQSRARHPPHSKYRIISPQVPKPQQTTPSLHTTKRNLWFTRLRSQFPHPHHLHRWRLWEWIRTSASSIPIPRPLSL